MRRGIVLSGKYRLVSLLGEGGMGAVWRAEDVRLAAAPVAIKLMHSREATNPEIRARFEAEARMAATLRSPHIVQVFDVGVDEDTGAPFIAMELLEGETLGRRLVRAGRLAPADVAKVVSHVARGLTRAHDFGVIHRDLKPANIFLVQNADAEVVKVLDFGIAKRSSQSWRQGPTATGDLLGTPIYMSPEQILSSKDVDYRTDLWSLAVIAVECLTGRLPFDSDNLPGLALLICQGQSTLPSKLGQVPPGFDRWFQRATSLHPEHRFESAAQMAEELRQLCGSAEVPTRRYEVAQDTRGRSGGDATSPATETEGKEHSTPPSVGPLSRTSTFARRLDPRRWPEPRGRRWAAAAALLVLLVATCSLWPGQTPVVVAGFAPSRGAEPLPLAISPPKENPTFERPLALQVEPSNEALQTPDGVSEKSSDQPGRESSASKEPASKRPAVARTRKPKKLPRRPAVEAAGADTAPRLQALKESATPPTESPSSPDQNNPWDRP